MASFLKDEIDPQRVQKEEHHLKHSCSTHGRSEDGPEPGKEERRQLLLTIVTLVASTLVLSSL